jgi:hypothetical protein
MATRGKGTGIVGYNVQIAVDAERHLIVAHEVTNVGSDRAQLTSMGHNAHEATGCGEVTVLADRGYYSATRLGSELAKNIRPHEIRDDVTILQQSISFSGVCRPTKA